MQTITMSELKQQTDKEIRATGFWGKIITGGLVVQLLSFGWYAAHQDAQVKQNTADIAELARRFDNSVSISISREQLEDILGSRDTKLENVEQAISRIEQKIDRLSQ